MNMRTESDSMGAMQVPADALYGAQTQRAILNFPISGLRMPERFLRALGLIKRCAAVANAQLGHLPDDMADAITLAAGDIAMGHYLSHFPVDVFQTGSGTSSNMNANEVIASLATQRLGRPVGANDHVNMGQSSNDVIPTAIHLSAALAIHHDLLPALLHLEQILGEKERSLAGIVKTGRTHLMDAMPVTMSQELAGWRQQIINARARLENSLTRLTRLAQGGTAVGTGINADPDFSAAFCRELSLLTGVDFRPAPCFFESLSTQDTAVEVSGGLRTLAVSLMKIANDLRWMNSGPLAGLGEIELPALQPGSSIMPGKVNPVIPEAVAMVAAQIMGNDATIAIAGQSGSFQLNVMLPLIAYNLLQSIELLANASRLLADKAVQGFTVREDQLGRALSRNPILVTALNPIIGYAKAAEIAKTAYRTQRPVIDVARELTDLDEATLLDLLDPARLTEGGIRGEGFGGG